MCVAVAAGWVNPLNTVGQYSNSSTEITEALSTSTWVFLRTKFFYAFWPFSTQIKSILGH